MLSNLLSTVCIDMMKQASALSNRPHILVCTPGRLVDHLRSSDVVDLSRIKFLVQSRTIEPKSPPYARHCRERQSSKKVGLTASVPALCTLQIHRCWTKRIDC